MKQFIYKLVIVLTICLFNLCFICNAREYNINDSNIETDIDCWVGWREWHFGAAEPNVKKGEIVKYRKMVIYEDKSIGYDENEVVAKGYGYYSFDFSKHMLGLLTYMKDRVSNIQTQYVPIYDQPEFDEYGNVIEPEAVSMKDAIEITINKLLRTWYSGEYEKNEFKDFWEKAIKVMDLKELKKLQNEFFFKAYGENAFIKLKEMMKDDDLDDDDLDEKQEQILRGVVLSIMESRYRNKNIQGKKNLSIKVAEGDLLPFLVNVKNIDDITREKKNDGTYLYKDKKNGYDYYEFPSFDELIDGAYLWMKYYDKDVISSTTNSTLTSFLGRDETGNSIEGEDIEIDWESEYSDLTGESLKTLTKSELEEFYDKCYKVKNLFKKSTENAEGIFGAEEVYDITSEMNFSEAVANMKTKMEEFCKGAEFSSVWTGLTDYNIERTYMMAKNIMSSNRIKDEYAYYNIGTNIITYTPGRQGTEYMLMDLQKINLKAPLKDENNKWTNEDSDNDGILDRNELGDSTRESEKETDMKIKVDITGFIKKAVERELYGNNEEDINNNQGYVREVLSKVKYNIYEQRNQFDKENSDNNKCNRKEEYENNLNVDDKTRIELNNLSTEEEKQKFLKANASKLEVELWKYRSNPVLKDTDFDGIDDGFGYERDEKGKYLYVDGEKVPIKLNAYKDKTPKENKFKGKLNSTRMSGIDGIDVDMNMDYRYFFLSNKLYYDELSEASILYANSIYMAGDSEHSGLQLKSGNNFISGVDMTNKTYRKEEIESNDIDKFNNMPVKEMMEHFGFKDVRTYYMGSPGDLGDENKDYFIKNYSEIDAKTKESTGRVDESKLEKDDTYKGKIGNRYKYKNENKYIDEIYMGYKDTHKGRVSIGYKNIEYHGLNKTVVGIVIRGTAEDDDWDSDFDMGDVRIKELSTPIRDKDLQELGYDTKYREELNHFIDGYPDWKHKNHHAGFDIVANRILEIVREYYNENYDLFDGEELDDNNLKNNKVPHTNEYEMDKICFWVMGHSMGGGVANLVGAELINGECNGNENNVYCYTFAAPNTFYKTDNNSDNYREPKGVKYRSIFNIVNEDDFVPELPMRDCGWTKYGREARISVKSEGYKNYSNLNINIKVKSSNDYSITNPNLYKFLIEYCGDSSNPVAIANAFSNLFDDKSIMRDSSYNYDEIIYRVVDGNKELDNLSFRYSLPFQKNNYEKTYTIYENYIKTTYKKEDTLYSKDGGRFKNSYSQKMSPQYLFTSIGEMMHEYSDYEKDSDEKGRKKVKGNKLKFFMIELPQKYYNARKSFFSFVPLNLRGIYIVHPHYLESYFVLTKIVNTNDFQ